MAGFLIFVLMRTAIRYAGLGLMLFGLSLSMIVSVSIPNILISEDGKLIGVRNGNVLNVNRSRPSKFISDQWQSAYLLEIEKPTKLDISELNFDPLTPQRSNVELLLDQEKLFQCFNTHYCLADYENHIIAALGKSEHLATACQFADIIVATFGINRTQRNECAAKTIISRYNLKENGSMALYFENSDQPHFRTVTAINEAVRPWTIQRYFNWRANEYWLPDGQTEKRTAN